MSSTIQKIKVSFNPNLIFIKNNRIIKSHEGQYYEVSRHQAMGICFMRWYNIAAKLYDLSSMRTRSQKLS